MADQSKPITQRPSEPAPASHQTAKLVTAVTIGAMLLALSGVTLTGTVLCLIIVTPALILFSPVLVPAMTVIFLATTGFLLSGAMAAVALSALSWMYSYLAGKHPPGSERLDYARMRLANKARDVKEKAMEYGQQVQNKAQEPKAQEPKPQAQETKSQAATKGQETKSSQTPKAQAS